VIKKRTFSQRQARIHIVANRQIRDPQVRVLDDQGKSLGVMETKDAMDKAWDEDKDLILINDSQKPPITKIIDAAKYKYQVKQKRAEGRKKAKNQELKEIRFKPFMGESDFQSRLKKVIGFLEKGDKVRITLQFRGRQITKKEFGEDVINRAIEATADIAQLEFAPKLVGKKLLAQLTPIKTTLTK
jgi:translation initiation factor IF-3